jgi:hypothetical protein
MWRGLEALGGLEKCRVAEIGDSERVAEIGDGMTISQHGLHVARFALAVCRIPHTQKWHDSVGTFGPPCDARGKPIAQAHGGQEPPFACLDAASGMVGTPSCGAWVCKCVGGFVPERELRKHFDKVGIQRHNATWEARLSQQKWVAAMLPKQSEPARKVREKTHNKDVLSITDMVVSSASSGSLNMVEERNQVSLQRPRAHTAQQWRVSDASVVVRVWLLPCFRSPSRRRVARNATLKKFKNIMISGGPSPSQRST